MDQQWIPGGHAVKSFLVSVVFVVFEALQLLVTMAGFLAAIGFGACWSVFLEALSAIGKRRGHEPDLAPSLPLQGSRSKSYGLSNNNYYSYEYYKNGDLRNVVLALLALMVAFLFYCVIALSTVITAAARRIAAYYYFQRHKVSG